MELAEEQQKEHTERTIDGKKAIDAHEQQLRIIPPRKYSLTVDETNAQSEFPRHGISQTYCTPGISRKIGEIVTETNIE